MLYEEYFDAFCVSAPVLSTNGAAFLRRRLVSEGIVAFQKGLKEAYDFVLLHLAQTGTVPDHLPFLCRDSVRPDCDQGDLLNLLGMFNKLDVLNVDPEAPWESFEARSVECRNCDAADWAGVIPSFELVRKWARLQLGAAPQRIICKHGPGATAEKLVAWDKWLGIHIGGNLRRCAPPSIRMVAVPKDVSGKRLIGIEHTERQFVQQGLARALRATRFFRRWIDLSDNAHHLAMACWPESRTIDLKDASDRIPPSLVEALIPSWFPSLATWTASFALLPRGKTLHLGMFATMGCGFCFEVETLVFNLLAIASGEPKTMADCDRLAGRISVYGDDVVIPEYCLPTWLDLCKKIGFVVNPKKTCLTASFRETVGYWILGESAKRRFTPSLQGDRQAILFGSDNAQQSIADLAFATGYRRLGRSLSLLSAAPRRWNSNLQRWEFRLSTSVLSKRPLSVCENTRYLAYWLTGDVDQHEEPTFDVELKRQWVPSETYSYSCQEMVFDHYTDNKLLLIIH